MARITGRSIAGFAVTALLLHGGAFAQEGSAQQREACTPDAFRLCGRYIPDGDRVEACLRAAGPRLSAPCYAVFYPQDARRANNGRNDRRYYGRAGRSAPPPSDDED